MRSFITLGGLIPQNAGIVLWGLALLGVAAICFSPHRYEDEPPRHVKKRQDV